MFFFFKQKTAYEMRISDWSSDVCSSDLRAEATINLSGQILHADASAVDMYAAIDLLADKLDRLLLKHKQKMVDNYRRGESIARSGEFTCSIPIGRASCRERVCQSV